MRGFIFISDDQKDRFIDICFDYYWEKNKDISKKDVIKMILSECNIDENLFSDGINNQKIKDELKNLTSDAFDKDVFGAPTFVINNKLFWGQDRLDYALEELND